MEATYIRTANINSMNHPDAKSEFQHRLNEHASSASRNSVRCDNERTTELFLVLPFISLLGFDTQDPDEVFPQFDTAPDGAEKAPVDFAIFRELRGEPKPFVLVEAKAFGRPIGQDEADQLKGYVGATTATFGLLTDGNRCQWYKRPPGKNFMDDTPFLVHSILEPSESEIEWLMAVSNRSMNRQDLERLAWRMNLENDIRGWLLSTFVDPGDPAAINKAANLGVPRKEHDVILDAARAVWSDLQLESMLIQPPRTHSHINLEVVLAPQLVLGEGDVLTTGERPRAWRIGNERWRKTDDATELVTTVLSELLRCDSRRNDQKLLARELGLDSFDSPPEGQRYKLIEGFSSVYCNTAVSNSDKGKLLERIARKIEVDPSAEHPITLGTKVECWLPTGGSRATRTTA